MPATINYFFAPISGYAYLGHGALMDLARETGASVRYYPLEIAKVFAAADTTPPFAQNPVRRSYRVEDQARIAARLGLSITAIPAHWPTPPGLACRAILAAGTLGLDQSKTSFCCLRAVWTEERDIADPDQLTEVLDAAGLPGGTILKHADTPEIAAAADACTAAAIDLGVFGSPTYVFGGQRFWGQDRLSFLRDAMFPGA